MELEPRFFSSTFSCDVDTALYEQQKTREGVIINAIVVKVL